MSEQSPELLSFGPHCFEIDGFGRGWCVLLGMMESWYGRGPSGFLLGPYRSRQNCAASVRGDINEHVGDVAWTLEQHDRKLDLASSATREQRFSNEELYPVWVVDIPGEAIFCSISTPLGVVGDYREEDPAKAANDAIDEKSNEEDTGP